MLILAELKKLIKNRSFLLYLLLLAVVNLFLIWFFNEPSTHNSPQQAYREMSEDLAGLSMEEKGEFINQRFEYTEAMYLLNELYSYGNINGTDDEYYKGMQELNADAIENYAGEYAKGVELSYTDSLGEEFAFINEIHAEYRQVAGYDEFLTEIEEAGNNLSSISIFADEDSYDNKNIVSTQLAYEGMRGTEIDYHPQKALMTATDFVATDIVLVFAMILISFALIQKEKETGLLRLIRCTAGGKAKTALAKVVALAVTLLGVVFIFYGINLIFCGVSYGLGDLTRSVQSVPDLMRSTLNLSVGGYIIVFMITKWMAALIIGLWILLSMLIANRLITGMLLSLTLPIGFYLVRGAISATSTLNVLRYANPISYLQTDEILGSYRNLYWFGGVVSMVTVEFLSAVILSVIILFVFFILFRYGQFAVMGRNMLYLPRLKKFKLTSVFKTEWRKVLLLGGGLPVIIIALIYQGYGLYSYNVYQDGSDYIYRDYMEKLGGTLTEEKGEFLASEEKRFEEIAELEKQLRYGMISEYQFNLMLSYNYYEYEEYKVFNDVLARVSYVSQNPGAQLLYDSGYRMLFELDETGFSKGFESSIIAILMTVVILGGYFSIERISGVRRILYSTPLGREQTVITKLINSAVICIIIAIITTLPPILEMLKMYGIDGLLSSAKSIPEYSSLPFFISILAVIIFEFILSLIAIAFVAAVTLTISQYNDSYITVVMSSFTIFLMPMILTFIGLPLVSFITVYPQFNYAKLLSQGLLWAAAPIFFAAVMCYVTYILCGRMIDKYCWNFTDL